VHVLFFWEVQLGVVLVGELFFGEWLDDVGVVCFDDGVECCAFGW